MWVRHGLHFKNIKNNKFFCVPLFIQSKKKTLFTKKDIQENHYLPKMLP